MKRSVFLLILLLYVSGFVHSVPGVARGFSESLTSTTMTGSFIGNLNKALLQTKSESVPDSVAAVWFDTRKYNSDRTAYVIKIKWYKPIGATWYHVERKMDDG